MRLCNATDTDFQYVRANRSSFTELKAWDCSEYRQTFDLHKNTSVEVYTGENENIRNLYTYRPTDLVGTPRLVFGKHTIYIRELINTERKIIEYRYGVDFDIK